MLSASSTQREKKETKKKVSIKRSRRATKQKPTLGFMESLCYTAIDIYPEERERIEGNPRK